MSSRRWALGSRRRGSCRARSRTKKTAVRKTSRGAPSLSRALFWEWASSPSRSVRRAQDRKSTRLNSSHLVISHALFCLKKKTQRRTPALVGYLGVLFIALLCPPPQPALLRTYGPGPPPDARRHKLLPEPEASIRLLDDQ